jgi:hypothetical protein
MEDDMTETLDVGAELCRRLKDFTARLEAGDDSLFRKSGDVSLRQDIARYLASLPPHVADRKAASLLREALTALDVADAIIAGVPEWTPVSERLPGEDIPHGYVIVRGTEPDQYGTANLQYNGEWTLCDEREDWKVAFWMPFPEPPATVAEQT